MAVHDYIATRTFGGKDDIIHPGTRLEFDPVVDDRWALLVTNEWVVQTTADAINQPDEVSNPEWTDPTP